MQNPLTLSLWLGVALYAAVSMFGVALFHDMGPIAQNLAEGYGVSDTAMQAERAP